MRLLSRPSQTSRAAKTLALTALAVSAMVSPARAGAQQEGVYAQLDGSTVSFPAADLPTGSFSTNASSVRTASGASIFLGPQTPFGTGFGSSQDHPYVYLGTAEGRATSVTTIEFTSPMPAGGWGFALGDIDADKITVEAWDEDGNKVPASGLGWKTSFNYCDASPRPSGCSGPAPFTDQPTWDSSTATLTGNGSDTSGAAGWFMPTAPVKKLQLSFDVLSGIPVYQLWIAACGTPQTSA